MRASHAGLPVGLFDSSTHGESALTSERSNPSFSPDHTRSDRPPEHSVLQRIAAGEPGATDECIERYGGLVWSLARRMCGDASEAEDAVQEIFIDLWRSAVRFDSAIASEPTFVAMIARRRLIDRGRKRQRRPTPTALPESIAAVSPDADTAEIGEESVVARRVFEQLRPEQRQVLQLALRHGQSHEQIATTIGLPLGTVKTHARRGLIRLRELLAAEGWSFGTEAASPSDTTRGAAPKPSSEEEGQAQ
ncbi:MAG: sigma-70 family RNA polymerase sigma factor [Phycisphaerae bacterium]|nr:sigma-70 family RNA polymerase sigma factor [Phycisphaerae bacterium]